MSPSLRNWARRPHPALVVCLALPLAGCFTGPTAKAPSASATSATTTPKAFSLFTGAFTSTAVMGKTTTNDAAKTAAFVVLSDPVTVSTGVGAMEVTKKQRIDVTTSNVGGIVNAAGTMTSNGASFVGDGVVYAANGVTATDSVRFTNRPGNDLDRSLGAPSLVYSYVGQGEMRPRAEGSTGDMARYVFAMFGGAKTTDMPTTGMADYAGTFEGREQRATTGSSAVTARDLSGQASLTADFAARRVAGQISSLNSQSGTERAAANYTLDFRGSINGSTFTGATSIVESPSKPTWYVTSGALSGGFFGPKAAEAAGALAVSANDGGANKILVTGAFGAKKQ
jgi:hypothetical protein